MLIRPSGEKSEKNLMVHVILLINAGRSHTSPSLILRANNTGGIISSLIGSFFVLQYYSYNFF